MFRFAISTKLFQKISLILRLVWVFSIVLFILISLLGAYLTWSKMREYANGLTNNIFVVGKTNTKKTADIKTFIELQEVMQSRASLQPSLQQ